MQLNAIDVFSGAGGLSLGLRRAEFNVMLAVDSWQLAVDTYTKNFEHPAVCADLGHLSPDELLKYIDFLPRQIDLLAGGPPCQGFSVQRIGADVDQRNDLVLRFAIMVAGLRPRAFLMENVIGLTGYRGQELLADFLDRVRKAG